MYKVYVKYLILFFLLLSGSLIIGKHDQCNYVLHARSLEENRGVLHYFKLTGLYRKWHEGLLGSRQYNKRLLEAFLNDLIGKEIETEKTFVLRSPDGYRRRSVECKFHSCRWLYLFGEIEKKSLLDLAKKEVLLKDKVLRSTVMFGVKGVVRKYRLGRDVSGDTVEIYLYGISLVY